MDQADTSNASSLGVPMPALPLVSIVVVNYNYGRYLNDCVQSVFTQSYPNIECVIVDNASTDNSREILNDLGTRFPTLKIIRRLANGGQSLASFDGVNSSSGEYIIFLDADDFLLPRAVETHVYAHLSLRIAVGFTNGDMIQCLHDRAVNSTSTGFAEFVLSQKGRMSDVLRPIEAVTPGLWHLRDCPPIEEADLHYQRPPEISPWVWSPMSANCFRRDAIAFLMPSNLDIFSATSGTDAYFIHGIASLMGSVLIDRPLAAYRLHGNNVFSKHPTLDKVKHFSSASESNNTVAANKSIIRHFIGNIEFLSQRLHNKYDILRALSAIDNLRPRVETSSKEFVSYTALETYRSIDLFFELFGKQNIIYWLFTMKVPLSKLLRLIFVIR